MGLQRRLLIIEPGVNLRLGRSGGGAAGREDRSVRSTAVSSEGNADSQVPVKGVTPTRTQCIVPSCHRRNAIKYSCSCQSQPGPRPRANTRLLAGAGTGIWVRRRAVIGVSIFRVRAAWPVGPTPTASARSQDHAGAAAMIRDQRSASKAESAAAPELFAGPP